MNRSWLVLCAGVAAFAGVVVSACAHNDSSIFIRDVLAPPQTSTGGSCVYTADPTQAALFSGALDVGLASTYTAVVLVGNRFQSTTDPTVGHTETNRVNIQGAVVRRVTLEDGGTPLNSYTTLTPLERWTRFKGRPHHTSSVSVVAVDPTSAAQKASVGLTPFTLANGLSGSTARIVSYIKVFGRTLGGLSVESNEFEFPITVCVGCLVSYPAGTDNPLYSSANCLVDGTPRGDRHRVCFGAGSVDPPAPHACSANRTSAAASTAEFLRSRMGE